MSRFATHQSQRDKPSNTTNSYRPSTTRSTTTTTTTTTTNPTRLRDRPALLQSRYNPSNYINNDDNVTDELPPLTQAPLFQTRTRGAPRLGLTGTSATGKEDLARIGSAWKTTMGDKTLDAEIDRAIGGDEEDERMKRMLKRTNSGDSAGRRSAESGRSWQVPGRSREEEEREKKREEEARMGRWARDTVEKTMAPKTMAPLKTRTYAESERRLEELQQKLKRDREKRHLAGLMDSDFVERIAEQEKEEERAPPSSPPVAFFRNRNPTVEDAPTRTDNYGYFDSRKQNDAARERRQKRELERKAGQLEKQDEPTATQQQDTYRYAQLADRRAQRKREQEERDEQKRAQRLREQAERDEQIRAQRLREQEEREERQRQREADRIADEEKAARRAAEREARQDQVAVLREKRNWSNANSNRFGTGLFTTNGTGKAPAQTRRRQSPPPPPPPPPPLPSKEREQRPKSPPPRQPSYQPINREIGINNAGLLDTDDEEVDHPQHQSEQSGTVEVPIPGTPAVLVKNSRKFWDKGKKKEEETTDTWTKLTRLAQTSCAREERRNAVPSPITEERSSQLVPPSPPHNPDEKPETAVLQRMEDLDGLGLNSTYPSDSTISSAGGPEGEDDDFSATRELEQKLGIKPPTDGETSDTEKEETQYFDLPSQQPTPPPEQPPKRPTRKPSPTRRPVGEPIRPGAPGRAASRPTKPRPRTPSPPTETASLDLNSPTLSLQHNQQPRCRSASPPKPIQKKPTPPPVSPHRPYDTDTSPDDTANETQLLLGINKKLRHVRSEVRNAHDGIENLERTLVTLEGPGGGDVTLGDMYRRAVRGGRSWIWRWRFWLAWPVIWGCWVLGEVLWIFWKLPPMYAGHVQGTGVPDVVLEDDAVWRYGIVGNLLRWGHEYFDYGGYAIGC